MKKWINIIKYNASNAYKICNYKFGLDFPVGLFLGKVRYFSSEERENFIVLLPNVKYKDYFISSLKSELLALKNVEYNLQYCLQTKDGNIDFWDRIESQFAWSDNQMYDEDFKDRGYQEDWDQFLRYSIVHKDLFHKKKIEDIDTYVKGVYLKLVGEKSSDLRNTILVVNKVFNNISKKINTDKSYVFKQQKRSFSTSFSSNSFPFSDKLIINSTYDNLVFDNGRSVLFIPSIIEAGGEKRKYGMCDIVSIVEDSHLMDVLYNVVKNLPGGDYRFEFYFNVVGCVSPVSNGIVKDVYTLDPFDKNCLNKLPMCSYGFKKLVGINLKLIDGNCIFQILSISIKLGRAVAIIQSSQGSEKKFKILLKEKVVLVIHKIVEGGCESKWLKINYSNYVEGNVKYLSPPKVSISCNDIVPNSVFRFNINKGNSNRNGFTIMNRTKHINGRKLYSTSNGVNEGVLSTKKNLILYSSRRFFSSSLLSYYANKLKDESVIDNSLEISKPVSIWKKGKFNSLYFSISEFNEKNLIEKFVNELNFNSTYSILIKFGFAENQLFYMDKSGQMGLVVKDTHDIEKYKRIYISTLDKLNDTIKEYRIEYGVTGIQIMYITLKDKPELKLIKGLSNFKLDTKLVNSNVRDLNLQYSSKFLPLTIDESYYGKQLIGEKLDVFMKEVNNQRSIYNKPVLSLEDVKSIYLNNGYVIISKKEDGNTIYREIYDFYLGILVKEVIDYIDDNGFNRKIGNNNLRIESEKIIYLESTKELDYIKSDKKISKGGTNNNIGTFDLETFIDDDGIGKVYALGFVTVGNRPNLYHLEDYKDSSSLVLACLNDMLSRSYHNYIFYTHNFGKFDVVFLLKIIEEANNISKDIIYNVNCVCRDNVILRLNISIKNNTTTTKISIIDSINLLSGSLDRLGKDYGSPISKGDFPHTFVNRNTLNYIGETPGKEYFNNIDNKSYLELYKKNWNLRDECLIYLERDLSTHLFVMESFNSYVFINYFLQMTESLTISRLSLNLFLKKYLKDSEIPLIKKYNQYDFIKKGYYGGVTEIYRPYGENLFYYDVNSLYPFVSKNYMPGKICSYIEDFTGKGLNLSELFGFFYCEVITNNGYLGLLPIHTEKGMINPNGKYSGVWSSEELKAAIQNGYSIKVIKGYTFNKVENIFDDYVDDLYHKKCYPESQTEKSVSKSLLNNNTGRWGMSITKPITKLEDGVGLDYILSTRLVCGYKTISKNKFLVTFIPRPSKDICNDHGLDYDKVIKRDYKSDMENINSFSDVSIPISATITAYARVYMNTIKLDILNKGGKIYYMDTDSIVSNIELPSEKVGIELGKFKLEHMIKKAYFISNKTYCLLLEDGNYIIKSKGVLSNDLTLKDFENMYYNNTNIKTLKGDTKTYYEKGFVDISKKVATLNHDAFIKREKIYNEKGLWVDTKPLVIKQS